MEGKTDLAERLAKALFKSAVDEMYVDTIYHFLGDESKALTMDGYDDCIAGVLERFGMEPIVVYDKQRVLEKLIRDGATEEEAYEFFEYNQLGAWMGDGTPGFINFVRRSE
jgi:nicotinamide riboside kinase|tara:strand:- start:628 stop:960 length:333 start_codon:yes stop_codon:yes gene_type:complete